MNIIKGDLLKLFSEGEFEYIGHQTNMMILSQYCTGIARAIFDRFPSTAHLNDLIVTRNPNFGDLSIEFGIYAFNTSDKVVNMYGQYNGGGGNVKKGDPDHYRKRFSYLHKICERMNEDQRLIGKTIGLPLIASGIAKAYKYRDYDDLGYFKKFIQPILEQKLTNMDITIVVYGKS